MGLISDKKMLPLIILFVLWKNSDEDHHLPTDELVTKVLEIYQPKESCSYESNKRLIVSYLRAMLLFFDEMKEYGYMKSITLGKEKYGLPEEEERVWTHFIRE